MPINTFLWSTLCTMERRQWRTICPWQRTLETVWALSGTVKTGGSHNFAQYDLMVSITLCNVLCMYENKLSVISYVCNGNRSLANLFIYLLFGSPFALFICYCMSSQCCVVTFISCGHVLNVLWLTVLEAGDNLTVSLFTFIYVINEVRYCAPEECAVYNKKLYKCYVLSFIKYFIRTNSFLVYWFLLILLI